MIVANNYWINILPSDKTGRWGSAGGIDGKWLVFGPTKELHLYQELLDKMVEEGIFKKIKIALKDPEYDPFPHKDCVICVFTSADENEKTEVARHLREIDLQPAEWKSEKSTISDWRPDGKLYLQDQIVKQKNEIRREDTPGPITHAAKIHAFISYAEPDGEIAKEICDALEANDCKCWFAGRDVLPGKHYDEEIVDGIEESAVIIVLISCHSNLSKHVRREIEIGLSLGKQLLPVKIENVEVGKRLRYFLAGIHELDIYRENDRPDIEKLIDVIGKFTADA